MCALRAARYIRGYRPEPGRFGHASSLAASARIETGQRL